MGLIVSPDVDAAVRRLTGGLFRVQVDDSGVYLVHFPTDERVCVVRVTRDGLAAVGNGSDGVGALLSERELEVFAMIGNGMDMREIAYQFGVSIKTIETYRARIKKKLGINNRTRLNTLAVEWAIVHRLANAETSDRRGRSA